MLPCFLTYYILLLGSYSLTSCTWQNYTILYCVCFSCLYFIKVWLIYSIVPSSPIQQNDLAYMYIHPFSYTFKALLCTPDFIFIFIFLFFFGFQGHTHGIWKFPGQGWNWSYKLLAYTTATATQDPSRISNLHHSSWQYRILNPPSKARDRTCVLMYASQVR